MKLHLHINGRERTLELLEGPPECRFRIDGDGEQTALAEAAEPGVYSILMEGRSYDARVEVNPRALVVTIDGYRFEVEVRDPRAWTGAAAGRGAAGAEVVAAPMPGKVVRVLVQAGDSIQAGQ